MFSAQKKQPQNAFASAPKNRSNHASDVSRAGSPLDSLGVLQRSFGNGYLQSLSQTNVQSAGARIQRACACGSCSSFATKEDPQARLQTKPIVDLSDQIAVQPDGVRIQRACACGGSCSSCMQGEDTQRKLQTKLEIGAPNDHYEQEADRVAEQVIQMSQGVGESHHNYPSLASTIQRIATQSSPQTQETSAIDLNPGEGQPLSPATRAFMEPRFGTSFEHVQLHTDERSQQQSAQINARAFTYGNHIWLGRNESEQDKRLVAHELTHVVQQGATLLPEQTISNSPAKNMAGNRVQRARLPCTTRTKVDVHAVNLPGSTRTIFDDLANVNSVLCQCGIEMNVTGGESWNTNILDLDPPTGTLNASGALPSRELSQMLQYRPGGNVIHAYYVPALQGPLAESVASTRFTPSLPDSLIVGNGASAIPIVVAHELGHVLLNDGSHHPNRDNLMAAGSNNSGAGELEPSQCSRMP